MSRDPFAIVCAVTAVAAVCAATAALIWPGQRPGTHRRPRRELPVVESPVSEVVVEHDWDGFLRYLTPRVVAEEYEPRLAEQAIEVPREADIEGDQ